MFCLVANASTLNGEPYKYYHHVYDHNPTEAEINLFKFNLADPKFDRRSGFGYLYSDEYYVDVKDNCMYVVDQFVDGNWVQLFETENLEEAKRYASEQRKNNEIITIDLRAEHTVICSDIPF